MRPSCIFIILVAYSSARSGLCVTITTSLGYVTGRDLLLKRLMDGDRSAPKEVLVPPDRLVVNESSDAYAVGSPNLRRALAIIRNNLSRPLGAKQIAAEMGVSHATLDRLFASELGRSAGSEILRRRLMKAKRLLSSTNMKLSAVAAECGFCHASHLVKTFSEAEGTTPGAWRQRQ